MDYSRIPLGGILPKFDLGEHLKEAQAYQMNELEMAHKAKANDLHAVESDAAMGEANALKSYRTRLGAGDEEGAAEELQGYPELDKKIFDAFDGMTPSQYKDAKTKARAFGEAARTVSAFPPGSPERNAAWNASADRLREEGHIDQHQHTQMIKGGPNDLLIDQALTIEQYVEKHAAKGKTALEDEKTRADIAKTKADTSRILNNQSPEDKAAHAENNRNRRAALRDLETYESKLMEGGVSTPEEVTAAVAKKKLELWDTYGIMDDAVDGTVTAPPDKNISQADLMTSGKGVVVKKQTTQAPGSAAASEVPSHLVGEGTEADPMTGIKSMADYESLPPGIVFINPADGKPYRKPSGDE